MASAKPRRRGQRGPGAGGRTTPGPGLTDLGWNQAHQVAADFADVLPGLREIEAGVYDGQPELAGAGFYDALKQWARGDRNARIPG